LWRVIGHMADPVFCSMLQRVAVCCSVVQCGAVCCSALVENYSALSIEKHLFLRDLVQLQHIATRYNTMQHTATHCNTLEHTGFCWTSYCCSCLMRHTRQHTAIHCNTLQHTATHCSTLGSAGPRTAAAASCDTLQHTAIHYNTLQHTVTCCNTLQHTHFCWISYCHSCPMCLWMHSKEPYIHLKEALQHLKEY